MRIEGYIEHPVMKITIFKMDNKYSVKFETELYEQTFKARTGNVIEGLEDVKKWINPAFQQKVLDRFNQMHLQNMEALSHLQLEEDEAFDDII